MHTKRDPQRERSREKKIVWGLSEKVTIMGRRSRERSREERGNKNLDHDTGMMMMRKTKGRGKGEFLRTEP